MSTRKVNAIARVAFQIPLYVESEFEHASQRVSNDAGAEFEETTTSDGGRLEIVGIFSMFMVW